MKLVKLTMLAATAAVVAMAFIGASSASATPPWISICKGAKVELLNCANRVTHPLLGRLIALVGKGSFKAGFVNIECEKGEGWSNQIEAQQSEKFLGTLEALHFTGCKGCEEVEVITPQNVVLKMTTETGGWVLETETTTAKVKFKKCILSQECTYEGNLSLPVQMEETVEGKVIETEAYVVPGGAAFKRVAPSTSLCAETGKWESGKTTFDWELNDKAFPLGTRHKNVFISLIGKELIKTL